MKKYLFVLLVILVGCKKNSIECQIQNELTPNSDSINDVFIVPCTNSDFPIKVIIFTNDSREAAVYMNADYKNDWDGRWNGYLIPDGLYFYRVQNRFMDKTGWLKLSH